MELKGKKKKGRIIAFAILIVLLLASLSQNVWYYFWGFDSYLQSTDEIYIMEAGILHNNMAFTPGEDLEIQYDFEHEEYPELIAKYGIDRTAGEGSAFEKALRLMNAYAPRLTHKSDYDNHVEMSALALLEYSLDKKNCGINCRNKAQILNEMCLALGIYARKVWIIPYSGYDSDCHVVNEVWDETLNKWVMLDITNNQYWVDEGGTPLSVMEIRKKGAMQEFCTPVEAGDSLTDLKALQKKHIGEFLYIMKNMAYMQYCSTYTVGEGRPLYGLFPKGFDPKGVPVISQEACEQSPLGSCVLKYSMRRIRVKI